MIIHIVAHNQQGIIGKSGPESLLWSIPEDMKLFSSLTRGTTMVMGRNTYESIGKPLPNRRTIIICSEKHHDTLHAHLAKDHPLACVTVMTIEKFREFLATPVNNNRTFVIVGGEMMYSEFKPNVVYKTLVDFEVDVNDGEQYAKYTPDLTGYFELRSDDLVSKTGLSYKVKCFVKQ